MHRAIKNPNKFNLLGLYMAVREGFEPSNGCPLHTFQACAFDHSATSPLRARIITYAPRLASPQVYDFWQYFSLLAVQPGAWRGLRFGTAEGAYIEPAAARVEGLDLQEFR